MILHDHWKRCFTYIMHDNSRVYTCTTNKKTVARGINWEKKKKNSFLKTFISFN